MGSVTTAKQTSAEILAASSGEENYQSQPSKQQNPFSPETHISALNTKGESGMQTSDIKTTKQKLEFSEKPIDTHLLDTPS